jgi:hypothetical protein
MSYRCKHQRYGFVRHGVEYVGEYNAVARTVIEPDYVDTLLDDAVAIWQRRSFVTVTESCVCLQPLRQLNVVTETFCGLARLKHIISLYERHEPLLDDSVETRANARKLRTIFSISLNRLDVRELTLSMRSGGGTMLVPVLEHAIVHTDRAQLDSRSGVGNASL